MNKVTFPQSTLCKVRKKNPLDNQFQSKGDCTGHLVGGKLSPPHNNQFHRLPTEPHVPSISTNPMNEWHPPQKAGHRDRELETTQD